MVALSKLILFISCLGTPNVGFYTLLVALFMVWSTELLGRYFGLSLSIAALTLLSQAEKA